MPSINSASQPRKLPLAFRILCHLSGADHQRLANCPLGDKQFAGRIGLQLLVSSAFLFTIFTASLLIGFGKDTVSDAIVVVMAFVTAAVVLLVDIQIVQSDFYQHGLELARDRGLGEGNSLWAKIRRPATVGLRLVLSMTIAFAFATFFELRLFGADILRQINTDYRSTNAVLFQDVQSSYDADVKLVDVEIGSDNATLNRLNREETALRARQLSAADADPEVSSLLQTIVRLTAQKEMVDAEVARRNGDAVNEFQGVKETPEQSGNRGEGPLYRVAVARAELARQESVRLAREIAVSQSRLAEVRARHAGALEKVKTDIATALRTLTAEIASVRARGDALVQKRDQMIANREASVLAIAQARPEFVPRTDGFLARVEALEMLKRRPAVAHVTFWTTLVIMAIEISAVLSKVFFSVPTLYSVRTALDFEEAVSGMVQAKRRPVQDAEADGIRKDIEIEELRAEFLAKRALRLSKEAALSELYSNGPDSNRSAS